MKRLLAFSVLAFAAACGKDTSAPKAEEIRIVPPSVTLAPLGTQQFALAPSTVAVSWAVQEATGGSVTAGGLYTAPPSPGVFHVVATSASTPAVSTTATITVDSGVTITAASPVTVAACDPVQLQATVSGGANGGVVWKAPADCGTVDASGVFRSLRGTGSCLVSASAAADPGKVALVTVNVTDERVLQIVLAPASASLAVTGSQQFGATVTTSCGTFPAH